MHAVIVNNGGNNAASKLICLETSSNLNLNTGGLCWLSCFYAPRENNIEKKRNGNKSCISPSQGKCENIENNGCLLWIEEGAHLS